MFWKKDEPETESATATDASTVGTPAATVPADSPDDSTEK